MATSSSPDFGEARSALSCKTLVPSGSFDMPGNRRDEHERRSMANEQHRFTWCMNSGALAILLHQTPLRFKGIDILADILFCIALVTYVVFSILFIARFVWFRKAAYLEIVDNIAELTFTSCWAISFMVLTGCVALLVSTASWGGYPFTIVAYVMWWFVQTWNACLLFWAFTILIRRHEPSNANLPFSIIIPAVSVSTVGLTGAVISTYAVGLSARLAIPVMIVSFQWTGVGILFGILLTSYLFWSLLTKGWPAPDQTATLFILVGPMGMYMRCYRSINDADNTFQANPRQPYKPSPRQHQLTAVSASTTPAPSSPQNQPRPWRQPASSSPSS